MIEVFDAKTDLAHNVIVRPELRGRFLRLEPMPAPPLHSHDLAGEVFLTISGALELTVNDETAILHAGQLSYVDKQVPHTLRALGSSPCTIFLSLSPHIEPTHTFYDDCGERLRQRYDAWRGMRRPDASAERGLPDIDRRFASGDLSQDCLEALRGLSAATDTALTIMQEAAVALADAVHSGAREQARLTIDQIWSYLRPLFAQVERLEETWNLLAPQAQCFEEDGEPTVIHIDDDPDMTTTPVEPLVSGPRVEP